MSEAQSPSTVSSAQATRRPSVTRPVARVPTAVAPLSAIVQVIARFSPTRRQRRRAQVLAAAQREDAAECARAVDRLRPLSTRRD
jgi:hypothetical protein